MSYSCSRENPDGSATDWGSGCTSYGQYIWVLNSGAYYFNNRHGGTLVDAGTCNSFVGIEGLVKTCGAMNWKYNCGVKGCIWWDKTYATFNYYRVALCITNRPVQTGDNLGLVSSNLKSTYPINNTEGGYYYYYFGEK